MSGVYERKRKKAPTNWVKEARDIRKEVNSLVRSEKVIPKSCRFTYGVGLFGIARDLVQHTRAAHDRYPSTPRAVIERRHYLQLAIDDCYYLVDELQSLRDDGHPVNLNRLADVSDLLEAEIGTLKGVKKNTKLIGRLDVDMRIERLEAELSDLRRLAEEQGT